MKFIHRGMLFQIQIPVRKPHCYNLSPAPFTLFLLKSLMLYLCVVTQVWTSITSKGVKTTQTFSYPSHNL